MRNLFVLPISLFAYAAQLPAIAADELKSCKGDPRIIEDCRWVKGSVGLGAQLTMFLDVRNEPSFALDYDTLGVILDLPGHYQVGEFEFCRFKDRTRDVLVDADGSTVPVPQAWGCVNAARNVIPDPDVKTVCEYTGDPQTCKAAAAEATP